MPDAVVDLEAEDKGKHWSYCAVVEHCCGDECRSYGCHVECDCYFETESGEPLSGIEG